MRAPTIRRAYFLPADRRSNEQTGYRHRTSVILFILDHQRSVFQGGDTLTRVFVTMVNSYSHANASEKIKITRRNYLTRLFGPRKNHEPQECPHEETWIQLPPPAAAAAANGEGGTTITAALPQNRRPRRKTVFGVESTFTFRCSLGRGNCGLITKGANRTRFRNECVPC